MEDSEKQQPLITLWELARCENEEMLTLEQVAKAMDVSDMTVRRWTQNENLPHIKVGGYIRIPRALFIPYLNERTSGFEYYDPGPLSEEEIQYQRYGSANAE